MLVGFALKRDVQIGSAMQGQTNEPFHKVPQIESHDEQLQHLRRVDALVLDEIRGDGDAFAAEQQATNVDGVILPERNQSVVDDLHLYRTIFYLLLKTQIVGQIFYFLVQVFGASLVL